MVDLAALTVTIPILVLMLAVAVRRADTLAAAGVSVLGAAFAVLVGAIGAGPAADQIYDVGSAVIFLSILLILGRLAGAEGVFTWAAAALARRAGRSPGALLRRVFLFAAATTAILSLDATVVLLTPVIVMTVGRMRLAPAPHSYACGHLANSASLLMPVSNLTNLLAFAATGLSFLSFTAVMVLPWLVAVLVEYALLHRIFAADLAGQAVQAPTETPPTPRLALTVVALTVVGFAICSVIGIAPVWSAAAGATALAARRLIDRTSTVAGILESANLSFGLFVVALAVIVRGIQESGLDDVLSAILPRGAGLCSLLAVAGIAAVLANLVNNLTATLALFPAAALIGTPTILAVLIGVNVGSNLTYVGSLANLLWRRVLEPYGEAPSAAAFSRVGALTVPLTLVAATTALWISLRLLP